MLTLFHALVGTAASAFSVCVDESDSVDDFKKAIKAEKPNTITCNADELQLYVAKKGDVWLTENELMRTAKSCLEAKSDANMVVTGNPGTGKSRFYL
ncbi:hypothetical protein P43SY_009972 [Pythium insidiosum]|uniref:Crinkler effector protein N-terminal domain-containing protein n=1 Tax=Pythium insidiosum TaxID=114742 RepID=A0AAD5LAZ9_PYTIN|nr:hypothetical protein P43SY_009972 [Pythium insidiosum]